jgi:NAD(P)-dependent dehydrogenase (short-subunit alcohol dehydrogenase family)
MIESLFSMRDKTCVVTGGSRGLGSYMAQGFLEAVAKRVYITARKRDACISAAEQLSEYGECIAIPSDVATSEGLQNLVSGLVPHEQHIDVLVNNAGAAEKPPLLPVLPLCSLHRQVLFITGQITPIDGGTSVVN